MESDDKTMKWLLILELCLISFALFKVYKIVKSYKAQSSAIHPLERLSTALDRVLGSGRVHHLLMTELKMIYYAFFAREGKHNKTAHLFSYHNSTQFKVIAIVFSIIILVESILIHILLYQFLISKYSNAWLNAIPWILHALEIYFVIFLIAQYRSIKLLPHYIENDHLTIQYGIIGKVVMPLADILSIEKAKELGILDKEDKQTFYAYFQMDTPQLEVECKSPVLLYRIYGKPKMINKAALLLDKPEELLNTIKEKRTRDVEADSVVTL